MTDYDKVKERILTILGEHETCDVEDVCNLIIDTEIKPLVEGIIKVAGNDFFIKHLLTSLGYEVGKK